MSDEKEQYTVNLTEEGAAVTVYDLLKDEFLIILYKTDYFKDEPLEGATLRIEAEVDLNDPDSKDSPTKDDSTSEDKENINEKYHYVYQSSQKTDKDGLAYYIVPYPKVIGSNTINYTVYETVAPEGYCIRTPGRFSITFQGDKIVDSKKIDTADSLQVLDFDDSHVKLSFNNVKQQFFDLSLIKFDYEFYKTPLDRVTFQLVQVDSEGNYFDMYENEYGEQLFMNYKASTSSSGVATFNNLALNPFNQGKQTLYFRLVETDIPSDYPHLNKERYYERLKSLFFKVEFDNFLIQNVEIIEEPDLLPEPTKYYKILNVTENSIEFAIYNPSLLIPFNLRQKALIEVDVLERVFSKEIIDWFDVYLRIRIYDNFRWRYTQPDLAIELTENFNILMSNVIIDLAEFFGIKPEDVSIELLDELFDIKTANMAMQLLEDKFNIKFEDFKIDMMDYLLKIRETGPTVRYFGRELGRYYELERVVNFNPRTTHKYYDGNKKWITDEYRERIKIFDEKGDKLYGS